MLTANNARLIATGEISIILHKIEEAAYNRQFELYLNKLLNASTVEVLKNLGYNVEYKESPIFEETPYGKIMENIVGYNKETVISWNA